MHFPAVLAVQAQLTGVYLGQEESQVRSLDIETLWTQSPVSTPVHRLEEFYLQRVMGKLTAGAESKLSS